MSSAKDSLSSAVDLLFGKGREERQLHQPGLQKRAKPKVKKPNVELALTVLLVELASADQRFDQQEYHVIANGLMRMFGTGRSDVNTLVNRAKLILNNLRGTQQFAEILCKELDEKSRKAILEVVDDVIAADGIKDGFEIYLRDKFARLLGLRE